MMLVDSSVWIDYFNGIDNQQAEMLDKTLGTESVVIGDLILTEVLQGFRLDEDYRNARRLFDSLTMFDMLGKEMALASAENYRYLRKQGTTIHKTAGVITATFCIKHRMPLLFSDKDFIPFVDHLGLVDGATV